MVFIKLKYLKVCKIAKIGENVLTNYANETHRPEHIIGHSQALVEKPSENL